jgi:hypothetical protein
MVVYFCSKFTLPNVGGLMNFLEDMGNKVSPIQRHALDVFEVFFKTLPKLN